MDERVEAISTVKISPMVLIGLVESKTVSVKMWRGDIDAKTAAQNDKPLGVSTFRHRLRSTS